MATIPAEALATLRRSEIDARSVKLPHQLARSDYVTVAKACATLGGKWSKSTKRIEFPAGTDAIRAALANDNGEHVDPQKDLGFFPTPKALAVHMCLTADLRTDHLCLEPSAGNGDILAEMCEAVAWVDAIELHPPHAEALRSLRIMRAARGPDKARFTVLQADFLTLEAEPIYDRIVMNPPFSAPGKMSADALHIMHAWHFLKPGGGVSLPLAAPASASAAPTAMSIYATSPNASAPSPPYRPEPSSRPERALRRAWSRSTSRLEHPPQEPQMPTLTRQHSLQLGMEVTNEKRDTVYRVLNLHRDGTCTVRALFGLNPDGSECLGYLGYDYSRLRRDLFTPFKRNPSAAPRTDDISRARHAPARLTFKHTFSLTFSVTAPQAASEWREINPELIRAALQERMEELATRSAESAAAEVGAPEETEEVASC